MWEQRLKRFLALLGLSLLLFAVPLSSLLHADVILTDAEVQEMQDLIQQSQEDLKELQKKSESAEAQLNDVKNDYEEQKKSYEQQLKEAKKDKAEAYIITCTTSASLMLVTIALIIALL